MTQTAVTISGSDGSQVAFTGDSYVNSHAQMFQSMTAQIASSGFSTFDASSNLLFVQSNAGNVGVVGGAASGTANILVGDGTNLSYIGGNSDVQILAGNGNNQIVAGNGNDTIALGTGQNQVFLGSGSSFVDSNGADSITAGAGSDTIAINGSNATVNGGFGGYGGPLTINEASGTTNTTINVITGTTINASSGAAQTVHSFGDTTINGSAGSTTDYDQQNGTLRFVGVGGSVIVSGSQNAGPDSLYGASGSNIVLTSSAHNNVFVANDPVADGGAVTLNGAAASGGNQFWAGSGNASLIGGTGGDTMVGGAGAATMMGGSGAAANLFALFADSSGGGTNLVIDGFGAVASNQLVLFGFGASAAATALAGETTATGGVTLHLANSATITLTGVSASMLSTQNVISTT